MSPATVRFRNALVATVVVSIGAARADAQGKGFQLERYEPTPAGEWFFAVEHPWYSSTRWFAGGLTLDYGHAPLVVVVKDAAGNQTNAGHDAVVGHQLVAHLDVAGSF